MGRQGDTIRSRAGKGVSVLVLSLTVLSSCAAQYRSHGYVPSESELATVTVGQATREDVLALLGAPTVSGVVNDTGFYYVQSRFRDFAYQAAQEIDRQVLVVSFGPSGTVSNIERFGLEDGQVVTLSRRVTQDNVRDTTFIRQLLGNVGNFDAANILSEG
jgi:outer membrane protein assembly factor BamE (lipoprotein component of BamABCDE complex)